MKRCIPQPMVLTHRLQLRSEQAQKDQEKRVQDKKVKDDNRFDGIEQRLAVIEAKLGIDDGILLPTRDAEERDQTGVVDGAGQDVPGGLSESQGNS